MVETTKLKKLLKAFLTSDNSDNLVELLSTLTNEDIGTLDALLEPDEMSGFLTFLSSKVALDQVNLKDKLSVIEANQEAFTSKEDTIAESSLIREQIALLRESIQKVKTIKGEKGDKGERGEKGETTIVDKIIEKTTEVIKEVPIVTENVVEVAKYEEATAIADKLNKQEGIIDVKVIKNIPTYTDEIKTLQNRTQLLNQITSGLQREIDNIPSTTPGGSNTQVQFNDSGVFGGDTGFTFNKTTNSLLVGGLSETSATVNVIGSSTVYNGFYIRNQNTGTNAGSTILFGNDATSQLGSFSTRSAAGIGLGGPNSFNIYTSYTGGAAPLSFGTRSIQRLFIKGETSSTNEVHIGIGSDVTFTTSTPPTASLHIQAGSTAAGTAPLKFNSGSLMTTPEVGAIEFNSDRFYGTITTGAARHTFGTLEAANTWTGLQYFSAGLQGSIYDNAGTPVLSINPNERKLYDTTGTGLSLDWGGRQLYDATGAILMLDWTNSGSNGIQFNQTGTYHGRLGSATEAGYFTDGATNQVYLANGSYAINATGNVYVIGNIDAVSSNSTYEGALASTTYAGYFTDTSGNYLYLSDSTYAINSAGQAHFTPNGGGSTVLNIMPSGYAMTWDAPTFWGGNLAGSGGAAYFYDTAGTPNTVTLSNGTNAITAVGATDLQGSLQVDSIVNDTGLAHGTYTPTLTGVTNVASSTAYQCQYMRVGNTVTVSGKVEVTPTANNTQTTIRISLPIPSAIANNYELGGTAHTIANTTPGHGASIEGDATNDEALMDYYETHGASDTFTFSFTYLII